MKAFNLSVSGLHVWRGLGLLGENKMGGGGGLRQGGGNWLKGWPAAPRNLSAMQSGAWPVFIYAERIFISAPFSLIGQEMAGIVTYLAAQGSCWAKTHRALAALP